MQKLLPNIRKYSYFYIFQQDCFPTHQRLSNCRTDSQSDSGYHFDYNVASKQCRSESGRLQNLVSYAEYGLKDKNKRRWWASAADSVSLGWIRSVCIDACIKQWGARLHICIGLMGEGYFEHTLKTLSNCLTKLHFNPLRFHRKHCQRYSEIKCISRITTLFDT